MKTRHMYGCRTCWDAPSSAFGTFSPTRSVGEKALDGKALPRKGRGVARRDTQSPSGAGANAAATHSLTRFSHAFYRLESTPKEGRGVARKDTQAPPTPEPTTPPPVHYPTINPLFSRSYRNLSSARLESTPKERKRCSKEGHQVCEKCGLTRHLLYPGTTERKIEPRRGQCQLVGQHWQPVTILNPHREMDEERRDHE